MTGLLTRMSPQTLRIVALLAVLMAVLLFFATQIDNYLTGRLFNRISSSVAIMALIATGQTLVILTRNIDLSVGSIVGFVAFATGSLIAALPGLHPVALVLFAMGLGGLFGAANGLVVAYARIPAIIVTLATLAIFRSLLVEFSDGRSITSNTLPDWLVSFPNTTVFSIGDFDFRAGFLAAFLVVIIVHLALNKLRAARRFYAVGSNPEAAEMAGIDTKRTVFTAFVLCGMLAGLAGFMFLARFGNITVVAGFGFELKSIAAAVLGGVNIFGGSGTVIGAFIGAVLVDLIETSLVRWPLVSEFWREAVLGTLILLAVTADAILMRRLIKLRTDREAARDHERERAAERDRATHAEAGS
ncbi:MAG: ABC transporter permease [Roseitalea sp.]|jgi:rhamnose transport system permease protein|nr:ABC transporter permease [Roseitalea sp.]MBO6721392.1 ABC transporter permease [Roseitalea sp.]MBO6744577.1 ABC transporter permease [Roseitalea sp.]